MNFEKAKKVNWVGFWRHAHPPLLLADNYLQFYDRNESELSNVNLKLFILKTAKRATKLYDYGSITTQKYYRKTLSSLKYLTDRAQHNTSSKLTLQFKRVEHTGNTSKTASDVHGRV